MVHTGVKNHICDVCGKGFNRNEHIQRHRKAYPNGACLLRYGDKFKVKSENLESSEKSAAKASEVKISKKKKLSGVNTTLVSSTKAS